MSFRWKTRTVFRGAHKLFLCTPTVYSTAILRAVIITIKITKSYVPPFWQQYWTSHSADLAQCLRTVHKMCTKGTQIATIWNNGIVNSNIDCNSIRAHWETNFIFHSSLKTLGWESCTSPYPTPLISHLNSLNLGLLNPKPTGTTILQKQMCFGNTFV